jgi:glutamate synthase domain-containing protein 2
MQKENNTIIQILTSNKYDASVLKTMNNRKVKAKYERERKCVKFTYVGKETRIITKHFKNTKVNVSFTTNNAIGKIPASQHQRTANKYDKCGVYQLTCPTCNMKYVGQTGSPFIVRFREHLRDFKYGNRKSKFATHLLDNGHSIGPINNVMETLHITDKGRMMDTPERFYIFEKQS